MSVTFCVNVRRGEIVTILHRAIVTILHRAIVTILHKPNLEANLKNPGMYHLILDKSLDLCDIGSVEGLASLKLSMPLHTKTP